MGIKMRYYWLVIGVSLGCIFLLKLLSYLQKNKINNSKSSSYSYSEFLNVVINIMSKNNINSDVTFIENRYYSYNQKNNCISIQEKKEYVSSDLFILLHEIGHYVDFSSNKRAFFVISKITIGIYIIYPIVIIMGILMLIANIQILMLPLFIISCVSIVMLLSKIVSIPFFEWRASKFAIGILTNLKWDKIEIVVYALLSLLDQLFFQILLLSPIILFVVIILVKFIA
jgi:hypothetical protein